MNKGFWLLMLLQLMAIPMVSEEKAVAVVKKYKTVYNLMEAYSKVSKTKEK